MDENTVNDTINNIVGASGSEKKEKQKLKKPDGLVKKSPVKKFTETFFAEDLNTFKRAFFKDLLIPGIKDLIFSSIQRLFYNGGPRSAPGAFSSYGSNLVRDYTQNVNYNAVSSSNRANANTKKFDFSDLIFRDMPAARDFQNEMKLQIAQEGKLFVSELYDALDKVGGLDITDNYYGWYSLDGSYIQPVPTGFLLVLPQPVQIK